MAIVYVAMTNLRDYDDNSVAVKASVDKFQLEQWIEKTEKSNEEKYKIQLKIRDELKKWEDTNPDKKSIMSERIIQINELTKKYDLEDWYPYSPETYEIVEIELI